MAGSLHSLPSTCHSPWRPSAADCPWGRQHSWPAEVRRRGGRRQVCTSRLMCCQCCCCRHHCGCKPSVTWGCLARQYAHAAWCTTDSCKSLNHLMHVVHVAFGDRLLAVWLFKPQELMDFMLTGQHASPGPLWGRHTCSSTEEASTPCCCSLPVHASTPAADTPPGCHIQTSGGRPVLLPPAMQ